MSVAIRRIQGIDSVKVSLNEGIADLRFKAGNRVDPEQIRQVVIDNGFTPKGADIELSGQIVERNGKLAVAVTGLDVVYLLVEHEGAEAKLAEARRGVGKTALVRGHLPEAKAARNADTPRTLELREFVIESK